MPSCGPSTMVMSRTGRSCGSCASAGDLGPADCRNSHLLKPRRNREAIIKQIRDSCLIMLGAPTVRVELDEQAVDFAIKQTLKIMEVYASRDYCTYYTFTCTPGKSVYKLPPEVGYVRQVTYRAAGDYAFQASDLGGSIPIDYLFPGSTSITGGSMFNPTQPIWGNAGEWLLYKGYERAYARASSAIGGWEFIGGYSNIKLYPVPYRAFPVIVQYMPRCNDWEEVTLAMQEGALAQCKLILGRIRGKIKNPAGPNGGVQLDGDQLLQEGKEELAAWKEDLIYRWGDVAGPSYG